MDKCFSDNYCDDDDVKEYFDNMKDWFTNFRQNMCRTWSMSDLSPDCQLAEMEGCQLSFLNELLARDEKPDVCR